MHPCIRVYLEKEKPSHPEREGQDGYAVMRPSDGASGVLMTEAPPDSESRVVLIMIAPLVVSYLLTTSLKGISSLWIAIQFTCPTVNFPSGCSSKMSGSPI